MARTRVGIIGAGIAGLVAGWELSRAGLETTIFERESAAGGLAGSFAIGPGETIEKYYHFICKPDRAYLEMMKALGIERSLRWASTKMGLCHLGGLHTIGDALSLFRLPFFSWRDKARFVLATAATKFARPNAWRGLAGESATDWLARRYGRRVYEVLYAPLLNLKFREHAAGISAAWMWHRMHRLGNSRTLAQTERLGFLVGGSQTYIDALAAALRARGGNILLQAPAAALVIEDDRVVGVRQEERVWRFDFVLSTAPVPAFLQLVGELDGAYFAKLRGLRYLDVLVMSLLLDHSLSRYFWLNLSDPLFHLPGIVEYTNLHPASAPGGRAVLYLPQYLPGEHPLTRLGDDELLRLYSEDLRRINPTFESSWVRGCWVHRCRWAQPICDLDFAERTPSIETPVAGLYLTDSHQIHPHDRTITDSTSLGRRAARLILEAARSR